MKILVTGDIADANIKDFSTNRLSEDFLNLIRNQDLVIYNLEGNIVNSYEEGKKYRLQFRENFVKDYFIKLINSYNTVIKGKDQVKVFSTKKILDLVKINKNVLFTLANNHIKDLGRKGFDQTVDILEEQKTPYIGSCTGKGVCKNFFEKEGVVCVNVNYTGTHKYGFPIHLYSATSKSFGAFYAPLQEFRDMVKYIKSTGKKVILILHAGKELAETEDKLGIDFEGVKNVGADVAIIHHPHLYVPTKYEKDNIFVLGDFIFKSGTDKLKKDRKSAVLEIIIQRNGLMKTNLIKFDVCEAYQY